MKKLLLCLLLTACGGEYKVSGNVTVTHEISIDDITRYFEASCADQYYYQDDIDRCVADKISGFFNFMNGTSNG